MSEKDSLEELQELLSKAGLLPDDEPISSPVKIDSVPGESNPDDRTWDKIEIDSPKHSAIEEEQKDSVGEISDEFQELSRQNLKDQRADTQIEVDFSVDNMSAYITVDPGYQQKLSSDFLHRLLKFRGVKFGLIDQAIETVAKRSLNGLRIIKVCIAKGQAPTVGQVGKITYYFEHELKPSHVINPRKQINSLLDNSMDTETFESITTVRKGQLLAEKMDSVGGVDGMDVRGKIIPHESVTDLSMVAGPNTELRDKCVYAIRNGRAVLSDSGVIGVIEIRTVDLEISADRMEAFISINPWGKDPVTPQIVEKIIQDEGIRYGLDKHVLDTVYDRIEKGLRVRKMRIAQGKRPIPGSGGQVRYYFEHTTLMKRSVEVPTEDSKAKLDYRESHSIMMVRKGQLIAEKFERQNGKNGIDVKGVTVEYYPARDYPLLPGENTELKNGLLYALCDGRPCFTMTGEVAVFQIFRVEGDLDLKMGNVEFLGDVEVEGSVLGGFEIIAGGDVIVGGSVEGAVIHAGKNIVIRGSYSGGERGELIAGESAYLSHVNSGIIRTQQHLFVRRELVNALAYVRGNLYMGSASSAIIGGKTYVSGEMNVHILGSPLEVNTFVSLGPQEFAVQDLRAVRQQLQDLQVRLNLAVNGLKKAESDLSNAHLSDKNRTDIIRRLKASVRRLSEKKSELVRKEETCNEIIRANHVSFLRVARRVNPGVRIKIGNSTVRIDSRQDKVEFFENFNKRKVEMRPVNMSLFRMEPEKSDEDK